MKKNRREFIKESGLAGLGLLGAGFMGSKDSNDNKPYDNRNKRNSFNMHGYAAPAIDSVGVAVIGLGNRGTGTTRRLASIEGVELKALCDLEPDRVERAKEAIQHTHHSPDGYSGGENEWKKICERDDIDLVAIVTPWHLHTPMCVFAMENDKHAYTELPAAQKIDECWQLVETSERTRKHCVQMSSSCHGGRQAYLLNMIRNGVFGELIHAESGYIHDLLRDYNFTKHMYHNMWRLNENIDRHGSLYPQHGFVPISQMMDLNYGDNVESLVSVSSKDFMMGETAKELAAEDSYWEEYVGRDYRGNMNITTMRTYKGRTIVIQHDVTSPRPRPHLPLISGTKGFYSNGSFATDHRGYKSDEEFQEMVDKYTPEITKRFNEAVSRARNTERAGHSYYNVSATDWRLIDCIRNGLPVEMDVYDAALSSAVIPLSEWSVANRFNSVRMPDFTSGAWKTNKRGMNVTLENGGGNTGIL